MCLPKFQCGVAHQACDTLLAHNATQRIQIGRRFDRWDTPIVESNGDWKMSRSDKKVRKRQN